MDSFRSICDCITGAPGKNKKRLPSSIAPDVPRYKKGSHQKRLSNIVINNAFIRFSRLDLANRKFADFDLFVDFITANKVKGVGATCIYDFCFNYGYKNGLRPERMVYIHTGPAASLKALRKLGLTDAEVVDNRVQLKSLPVEIQQLGAAYAEDFLCVFHNHLTQMADNLPK